MTVTVTTRVAKGTPLTHLELDANFDDLAAGVNQLFTDFDDEHTALDARITQNEVDIVQLQADVDTAESDIVAHDSRLDAVEAHAAAAAGNPHAVTKADVGLSNVTNDAQLKRADGDILTFDEETVPVMEDVVLIEKADGTKKKIQLGNIPSTGASSEADIYQDVLGDSKYQHATYDDLNDEDLINGTNTDASYSQNDTRYDFTAGEVIESDDLYDSDAGLSEITECLVLAIYTDSGTPTIEATADGGTNWETVTLNTVHTFTDTGTDLRLRFTAGGTGHLDSWAVFYNPDETAIVEPVDWLKWNNNDPDDFVLAAEENNPNLLINGGFDFWQRATSISGPLSATYSTADRWIFYDGSDGTANISQQTFTPGQTDVPGEPRWYVEHDMVTAATAGGPGIWQRIESVRSCAGQAGTLSFWAKVDSGTLEVTPWVYQNFGSSGSALVQTEFADKAVTITTDWTLHTITMDVPSITGKTILGGDDFLQVGFSLPLNETWTLGFAQAKFEVGSVATPFVRRPYGLELALCQRYYQAPDSHYTQYMQMGNNFTAGQNYYTCSKFDTPMRAVPTLTITYVSEAGSAFNGLVIGDITATPKVNGFRWYVPTKVTSSSPASVSLNFEADAEL